MNEINFNIEETEKIDLSMDVGIKEVYPPIENLEITPTKEQQLFNHENSYGYDEVIVEPIPDEYIIPDGILEISENGVTDVTSYAEVNVNIETITPEDLTEELNTYNAELTEQETTINNIVETLKTKAIGGGDDMVRYSTEETVIGTWIDGKPLYSKVILIGTVSTTETDTPVNIPDLDTIKKIEGGGYMSNGHFLPWNFENSGGFVSCYYSVQNSTIRTIVSTKSYEIHNCFAIIEYTKTTD